MEPHALVGDRPRYPVKLVVDEIGFDTKVTSQWLVRSRWLRDLPPEELERGAKAGGHRVRATLWVIVMLGIAVELARCGVRPEKALEAGFYFTNSGKARPLSPNDPRVPDELNREPGKLFAGRVGTWLIYRGPRDLAVVASPQDEPLRLDHAFEAANVSGGKASLSSACIVVDLDGLCQRIAAVLELPFAETFKTPSRASASDQS